MPSGAEPAPESAPRFAQYLAVFASRRMAAMLALGFASGLPLALSAGTLQAWLTVSDVDIQTIGYFALVGLPYTFKVVWAPLMDRVEPPRIGRRRGWLVATQAGIAACCFGMAVLDPVADTRLLAMLGLALAFLSASQDIVFDAYRSDLLEPAERGAGAALSVLGYRLAMIVSGGLALILADSVLGWPATFRLMGGLMLLMMAVSLLSPALRDSVRPTGSVRAEVIGFAAMVGAGAAVFALTRWLPQGWTEGQPFLGLAFNSASMIAAFTAALWAARTAGFPSFVQPWDAFFSRRHAAALLTLIVLYKLGDAFAGSLSTTFLIRGAGFSATDVGAVNKVLGLTATIVGALAGGAWLAQRTLYQALWVFGLLQAVSNFGYWLIAVLPKSYALMASAVFVENLCGGLGTAAFVAFLMALTDRRFSAAQYALLSALAAVGRIYVGPAAGVMVAAFGWPLFFALTVLTALPGLLVLYLLRDTVRALDAPR
ncbi:MAG: MFS transporter [Burkholderiaceae bacterium]